jgi:hypothetical protein
LVALHPFLTALPRGSGRMPKAKNNGIKENRPTALLLKQTNTGTLF